MSATNETFFTSVGCMDGRVQAPIARFGKEKFDADYPDTITRAGLDGMLPTHTGDTYLLDSIKIKLLISIEKHHSKGIIVHGHTECAGNPVDDAQHRKDVFKTVSLIKALIAPHSIPVIGAFVRRSEKIPSEWVVEEI